MEKHLRWRTHFGGRGGLWSLLGRCAGLMLAVALQTVAQQPGRITDPVVTAKDPRQSYALYLPSSYTPAKRYPVIFAFDPGARGKVPVEVFAPAAESRGYIVVGSNNSQNGPFQPPIEAFLAMLDDVQQRFAVDPQRLYAAGFSGGARVAGLAGFFCSGCIHAVIACGAGLPLGLNSDRQAQLPPYFFAVGRYDFNYFEVLDAARALRSPRRLAVFEGLHQWPPPEIAAQAVEWLEAGAKSGDVPPPDSEEAKERRLQEEVTSHLSMLLTTAAQQSDDREQNLADAAHEMAALRKKREKATGTRTAALRRALGQVLVQAYETAQHFEQEKQPAWAARSYEVAAEATPANMELTYKIASIWASAGDKKKSLAALRRAVTLGFHNMQALAADKHFDSIRNLPEFKAIVK